MKILLKYDYCFLPLFFLPQDPPIAPFAPSSVSGLFFCPHHTHIHAYRDVHIRMYICTCNMLSLFSGATITLLNKNNS